MSKVKKGGQIFTKQNTIDFMLDRTYDPTCMNFILEPGCGDGRIIVSLIKRIIENFEDPTIINDKISKIYGFEIDEINYNKSIKNIDTLLSHYPEISAKPNILFCDALINEYIKNIKFDYIIGNPPYIRIHNLEKSYLDLLQIEYNFLKNGMVDIYYGFIELYKKCLAEHGTLCFITPNSFLYNKSSEGMIDTIYSDKMFNAIYDFKSDKLFDDASTYTAITILKKTENSFKFIFSNKNFETLSEKEILYGQSGVNFLNEIQNNINGRKFSELYKARTGFATLADKVFVIEDFIEEDNNLKFTKNGTIYTIEKSIVRKCIKASRYKNGYNYVIFPYNTINGKYIVMSEEDLIMNYPKAHEYLSSNKPKLLKRDKGKKDVKYKWYEWGRSQALNSSSGKKIIISTIYEKNPFIFIDEDVFVYSGYYIKTDVDIPLLRDEKFLSALKAISKPTGGGWYSLQKKILDNVIINLEN